MRQLAPKRSRLINSTSGKGENIHFDFGVNCSFNNTYNLTVFVDIFRYVYITFCSDVYGLGRIFGSPFNIIHSRTTSPLYVLNAKHIIELTSL